jgi:hypothetical protein
MQDTRINRFLWPSLKIGSDKLLAIQIPAAGSENIFLNCRNSKRAGKLTLVPIPPRLNRAIGNLGVSQRFLTDYALESNSYCPDSLPQFPLRRIGLSRNFARMHGLTPRVS